MFGRMGHPHWSEVLGLPRAATFTEIKARWRELALEPHPDRGGDPEAFVRAKDAFDRAARQKSGLDGG
jgi:curved DNA-binding protein CbpA